MSVIKKKTELRNKIKELKSNFSLHERTSQSKAIIEKLEQLPLFINAKIVVIYWSMDDEVETHAFINRWWKSKIILLPSVSGNSLNLKQFKGHSSMQSGENFGIQEPVGECFYDMNKVDLIIVPGLAFDKNNNRMGRGRGYYDRLLQTTNAFTIGVCFDFQFVNHVPTEEHDLAMGMVLLSSYNRGR